MKNVATKQTENILELEKSYQEQLSKIGQQGYDPVLTLLLQKELNRMRRIAAFPKSEVPVSFKRYKRVAVS
jgi:hypothetical protein